MNDIVKQHIRSLNNKVDKEWFQIQIKSLEEKLDRRNDKLRR